MNYNFHLPPNKQNETNLLGLNGGSNYAVEEIYLWSYEEAHWLISQEDAVWLWSRILEEEHIHNLLRKLGISIEDHHWFIDKVLNPIILGASGLIS